MDVKKLEGLVSNGYRFLQRLGDGSFGVVYEAEKLSDGKRYAIKVESSRATSSQIYFEYDVYIYFHLFLKDLQLTGGLPVPCIYGLFSNKDITFFVMDLLGPSMHDVFRKNQKQLSPIAVVDYAKQMITLVRKIHTMSFVYRDIKPENFVFKDKEEKQLKLVDFGLAKKMSLPSKKLIYKRYASVAAHEGKSLSRKDDMESLVYVIIYLIKGSLPWQGIRAKTEQEKDNLVYKMKKSITAKELCGKLPEAFQKLVNYVKDEDFFDKAECYTQMTDYLDESLEEFKKVTETINETEKWMEMDFIDSPRNLNARGAFKPEFTSPPTAQKLTSSNEATNTYDKTDEQGDMKKGTPTKKKPIKMPTIKKKFMFNDDSDNEQQIERNKMRKKSSNFIEDEDDA